MKIHAVSATILRAGVLQLCLLPVAGMVPSANAGQRPAQASLAISIVIPSHCMEVLGDDEQLESGLRDKRLLCKQKTGQGKPVRIVIADYARFTAGEPNAVHRAGFE